MASPDLYTAHLFSSFIIQGLTILSAFNGPLFLERKGTFIGSRMLDNSAPSPHQLDLTKLFLSLSLMYNKIP